jgi:hypothetical protein
MGLIKTITNYVKRLSLAESIARTGVEQGFYTPVTEDPMQTAFEHFDVQTNPENACAFYDAMRRTRHLG